MNRKQRGIALVAWLAAACGARTAPQVATDEPLVAFCAVDAPRVRVGEAVSLQGRWEGSATVAEQRWFVTEAPPSAAAELDGADSPTASLTPDTAGTWRARYEVRGSDGERASCAVALVATVGEPVARCPPSPQWVRVGDALRLDLGGTAADVSWSVHPRAQLEPRTGRTVSFRADRPGTYEVQVRAADGDDTATCVVRVEATRNEALECRPARASVHVGVAVAVEARGAAEPSWTLREAPTGSAAGLTPRAGARTVLRPDLPGDFVVRATTAGEATWCESTITAGEPPRLDCGGPVLATLGEPTAVTAALREVPLSLSWALVDAPPGSRVTAPAPLDELPSSLTPDVVGTYLLRLSARFATGEESCDLRVLAPSPDGLRFELRWDRTDADMDLHLLHPSAERRSDPDWDCYFSNCEGEPLRWFGPDPADDPRIDLDVTAREGGLGPEVLRIPRPAPATYRLGVYGFTRGATCEVRVFCGVGALEPAAELGPAAVEEGEFWRPADITVTPDGGCVVAPPADDDDL